MSCPDDLETGFIHTRCVVRCVPTLGASCFAWFPMGAASRPFYEAFTLDVKSDRLLENLPEWTPITNAP